MSEDDGELGVAESTSMALGGMIGGGIFAVLGVVAQITRAATWVAFVLAGIVALSAAYSYIRLNDLCEDNGGSVTFVQSFTGNSTAAGMIGWTLLFGYIGSMAMYAYAFGSFFVGLAVVPSPPGVPLRPLVSVAAVGAFVGLNLLGARATGMTENLLVGAKVAILLVFGVAGLIYGFQRGQLEYGFDQAISFGPIMAAAISFVAFQGWQLPFYDQESIANPTETLRTSVFLSIVTAVGIYIIVAITTVSLVSPEVITNHPEQALAIAAQPLLGPLGFTLISVSALFSTGSAINATLFSSAYFAKGMVTQDLLPDHISDGTTSGVPARTVLVLGGITAAFSAYGSLDAITSFASLSFIVVFGTMSALAFRARDQASINPVIPTVGVIGTLTFYPLMFYHLYTTQRETFYGVVLISVAVTVVELLYFERDRLEAEIDPFEADVAQRLRRQR